MASAKELIKWIKKEGADERAVIKVDNFVITVDRVRVDQTPRGFRVKLAVVHPKGIGISALTFEEPYLADDSGIELVKVGGRRKAAKRG